MLSRWLISYLCWILSIWLWWSDVFINRCIDIFSNQFSVEFFRRPSPVNFCSRRFRFAPSILFILLRGFLNKYSAILLEFLSLTLDSLSANRLYTFLFTIRCRDAFNLRVSVFGVATTVLMARIFANRLIWRRWWGSRISHMPLWDLNFILTVGTCNFEQSFCFSSHDELFEEHDVIHSAFFSFLETHSQLLSVFVSHSEEISEKFSPQRTLEHLAVWVSTFSKISSRALSSSSQFSTVDSQFVSQDDPGVSMLSFLDLHPSKQDSLVQSSLAL